ncbi:MAG: hypothetical protein WBA77_01690 [Microcoleaceae cyanobacterium]
MEDILVPLGFFAVIPTTVWAVSAYRHKSHAATIGLLETMAGKGDPITPEIVETLGVQRRPRHADLRTGLILIAVALATLFTGTISPDDEATTVFAAVASFPLLVGLVFVGLWFGISRRDAD